jgi:hypothetical protein
MSYAAKSVLMFIVSVVFFVLITVFEAALAGLPQTGERIISGLLLVLPGIIGVIFGVFSLLRREENRWRGFAGILLNGLFALFHIFLLGFAG